MNRVLDRRFALSAFIGVHLRFRVLDRLCRRSLFGVQ
jgi:hypothetical protein